MLTVPSCKRKGAKYINYGIKFMFNRKDIERN